MNVAKRHPRMISRQRGASMIYMAFFIQVAAIFIILLGDMSQLVFEKIKLQQTVDEAALSAANIQAIGLNEIADLNRAARLEHATAQQSLAVSPPWWGQSHSQALIDKQHDPVFKVLDDYRNEANREYAELAFDYAKEVVDKNIPRGSGVRLSQVGGASNNSLTDYNKIIEYPIVYLNYTVPCSYSGSPCVSASNFRYPNKSVYREAYFDRDSAYVMSAFRNVPVPAIYNPKVKWVKSPARTTYAAYKLELPQKRFSIGGTFLKNFFPKLTAYAAAKPTGGSLYQERATYVARLAHLSKLKPLPLVPNLSSVDH